MNDDKLSNDPIANPASTISGPNYRFTLLTPLVLRYEWSADNSFEDRPSTFATHRNFPSPDFRTIDSPNNLQIISPNFHLTYNKTRFSPHGLVVTFNAKLTDHGAEWRFGQQTDRLNLGGTARTLDLIDGRCDMGTGILSRAGYAVLDDSESMVFDDKTSFLTPRPEGDRVDGYIFAYGQDYKAAMEAFYAISGQQPVVPRWCLGNWWSRYYAYTEREYLALMRKFGSEGVPLSVAVIDMDWHWVKEEFVEHTGWTGYSWNKDLFPDPKGFLDKLHEMKLKTTLNDHPHSGVHSHEDVYEELAQALNHDTGHKDPIHFDPTSPEFMHAFLNVVHRGVEKDGVDFWWIDWQQGLQSRVPGFDPLWALNHFQYLDTQKSKPDSLPIIFSRYAGPGSHRYPVGFSGDTVASWKSLRFQPEFTATASNIGFGWWSHDIGGHLPGYRDDECAARWVQYGVYSPILRLHSTVNKWMSKEPWLYRSEYMEAMRDAMQFRHRLVPYIYSVNADGKSRLPLVQPLYWQYPERGVAYHYPNQYHFGPSMIVAPIVDPRDERSNLAEAKMWIPPRRHVDMFTGTVYDGDREVKVYRDLDRVPVLLPEGSIVPLDGEAIPGNGCLNPVGFEVLVVVGREGQFELVEDARDDQGPQGDNSTQRANVITFDQAAGRWCCDSGGKDWRFRFISSAIDPSAVQVSVDGAPFEEARVHKVAASASGHSDVVVEIPADLPASDKIEIQLGPNPQLAVLDHTEALETILRNYQTGFKHKDNIWTILKSRQTLSVQIGRLLSLELDEVFTGPIVELMLADSRWQGIVV
ncbi:glycoside hydrolase family 31 protein [Cercospora zeae-maydis SCOH1-5]|uniref:alpha-glucosidase n=1 Tax=Cercospora zeae-maydis SCOH1-5 TaxID=717836 RepID=A0A6A6FFX9_9PEZI|nr:glycoside hydrolase family 31 protein [Cercospora zeae-maydis SCOH1-5]